MITYEVIINLDSEIESKWVKWMKKTHIPEVISTGLIVSFSFLKPLEIKQQYILHYLFKSMQDYKKYEFEFAPKLKADTITTFPNQFKAERKIYNWV